MRSTILAAAFVSAFAQSGAQPFAGTWTAALAGQTYAQLELKVTGGSIGDNYDSELSISAAKAPSKR